MLHYFRLAAALALTLLAGAVAAAQTPATPAPASSPSATPTDTTAANPPENPLVTARVRQEFIAWQNGRIDRTTYSPEAGGVYINALVRNAEPDLKAIGPPQTVTYRTASLLFGDFVYRYDVSGPAGVISVLYSLDERGKTDGIVFTPRIFTVPASSQ